MGNNIERIKELQQMIDKLQERNQQLETKLRVNPDYLFCDIWKMEITQNNCDIETYKEEIEKIKELTKNNDIKICIDTTQHNINPQCLQEIIDLLIINPTQTEIEEILKEYKVMFETFKNRYREGEGL